MLRRVFPPHSTLVEPALRLLACGLEVNRIVSDGHAHEERATHTCRSCSTATVQRTHTSLRDQLWQRSPCRAVCGASHVRLHARFRGVDWVRHHCGRCPSNARTAHPGCKLPVLKSVELGKLRADHWGSAQVAGRVDGFSGCTSHETAEHSRKTVLLHDVRQRRHRVEVELLLLNRREVHWRVHQGASRPRACRSVDLFPVGQRPLPEAAQSAP